MHTILALYNMYVVLSSHTYHTHKVQHACLNSLVGCMYETCTPKVHTPGAALADTNTAIVAKKGVQLRDIRTGMALC